MVQYYYSKHFSKKHGYDWALDTCFCAKTAIVAITIMLKHHYYILIIEIFCTDDAASQKQH